MIRILVDSSCDYFQSEAAEIGVDLIPLVVTIDGVEYELHQGESIVMPAKHPHAVFGKEQFKMLLVVIF